MSTAIDTALSLVEPVRSRLEGVVGAARSALGSSEAAAARPSVEKRTSVDVQRPARMVATGVRDGPRHCLYRRDPPDPAKQPHKHG
jgi:hypothetical protein